MPDTKISALTTGTTPQDTDEFAIRRSTGNNKLTWAQMRAAVSGAGVSSVNTRTGDVTLAKADVGLSNVDNTSDANKPLSTAAVTALAAKADLVGGKLNTSQLPDIAIVDYLGAVANQTAMLALTGQKGDWCTRTDSGTTWIITGSNPTLIGSWTQLSYPASPVTSVAGKTGVVTLAAADIGDSTSTGRAVLVAADQAAGRSALGLGTLATGNALAPPALGGTTPAAGTFSVLTATVELTMPSSAPGTPSAGDLYRVADTVRYRDSTNTERLLLNATDNLANLANAGTARTNLGAMGLEFGHAAITYAATVTLDMAALAGTYRTISLTGVLTLASSNRAAGRSVTLRLIGDASSRALTFPAGWVFIGAAAPTALAAGKTAILTLSFFGTADSDCVAAYGVQP